MSIAVQTVNGVARIAIARPEKKNAITVAMYQAMADAIGAAHDDGSVRAILIHGEKDIFTAGNDLEDFMKNPPSGMDAPVF
ncbi:MAG TPA: enoyl-CoA hydratase-related protein, partial [Burkholderiaceae bacterium]|nr:enoyl-CoA hydratase-related protein [Burkholderiaceae bacterium]